MKYGSLKPCLLLLISCMYYGMFSSLTTYSVFEDTYIISSSNMLLNRSFCWLFCSSLECFTNCIILWKYCLAIVSFINLGKKLKTQSSSNSLTLLITVIHCLLSDYLMWKLHTFILEFALTILVDMLNYSGLALNSALFFVCLFSHV